MNPLAAICADNLPQLSELAQLKRGWISALAVASAQRISLHLAPTRKLQGTLEGHTGPVKAITVNADGTPPACGI